MTVQDYLDFFDGQIKPTESLFRSVPPEKLDWKPTESSFTLGQQMAHLVGALELYGRGIATGDWGFTSMRERFLMNRNAPTVSVEGGIKALHEKYGLFKQYVGVLTEEEFNVGEVDAPQFGGRTKRWRVAMLAAEHHITHKTELFVSLKLLGVKVNTGHLYRG